MIRKIFIMLLVFNCLLYNIIFANIVIPTANSNKIPTDMIGKNSINNKKIDIMEIHNKKIEQRKFNLQIKQPIIKK